ncbi:MAG: response regulator [Alphaproteobacteria bacterium]|nr:response regulator [Alphaproteobacteria bacterium]
MSARILVVDDEAAIRRLARVALERAGLAVREAENAREALLFANAERPDLVLLDLGLPDRDGLELVPLLKAKGLAVIIVSARDSTSEKVAALDLGADDYVTKPFDSEELLARIRAALRHRAGTKAIAPLVNIGRISLDLAGHIVCRDGMEVHLTRKEHDVLAVLARSPGRVVTHKALLAAVWPDVTDPPMEYLRIVVRNLRQKLETDPSRPSLIRNETGIGYRLSSD